MTTSKSLHRKKRYERHLTAKKKGTPDGACVHQQLEGVGTWPSGRAKQQVTYLHATKGWRVRLLPPARWGA